jgi:hypothetical protein
MEQIKNRYTGEIMFGGLSLKVVIEKHIKWLNNEHGGIRADLRGADLSGAVLRGADLRGADLRDADLSGADLRGADLSRAVLRDADLRGADLRGADLRGADLSRAVLRDADLSGAVLRGAVLRGADLRGAVLRGAVLRGAVLRGADLSRAPSCLKIKDIHQTIYNAVKNPNALDMSQWHTCDTTHCRAGWVVTLAGDAGKVLEWQIGTAAAAAIIYQLSDPELERVPDFYCDNETAMKDMERLAKLEAEKNNE